MLEKIDLKKILFLDIETVSAEKEFDLLPEYFKPLWRSKAARLSHLPAEELTDEQCQELYSDRAGIYAEFGKIVCISVGAFVPDGENKNRYHFRLKSYAHREESILLKEFSTMLGSRYTDPNTQYLCGHNIREFDIPYICRRLVANQLPLPKILDISGKKPWETKYLLDTMELWRFGDYKNYTSLKLLAAVMGFPSPKDDIDGSEVGRVFWQDDDLDRIAVYCEKDVLAVAQLLLRYRREPVLENDQILTDDKLPNGENLET